jgi:mono/diheme cytochrome c family protein
MADSRRLRQKRFAMFSTAACLLFIVAVIIFISGNTSFSLNGYRATPLTLKEHGALGKLKKDTLTPFEKKGEGVYLSMGCVACHGANSPPQNFVKPPSLAYQKDRWLHSDGVYRIGPELTMVSDRHGFDWHLAHLLQPDRVIGLSRMPAFPALKKKAEAIIPWFIANTKGPGVSGLALYPWNGNGINRLGQVLNDFTYKPPMRDYTSASDWEIDNLGLTKAEYSVFFKALDRNRDFLLDSLDYPSLLARQDLKSQSEWFLKGLGFADGEILDEYDLARLIPTLPKLRRSEAMQVFPGILPDALIEKQYVVELYLEWIEETALKALNQTLQGFDISQSATGRIDRTLSPLIKDVLTEPEISYLFRYLDRDRSGSITSSDFADSEVPSQDAVALIRYLEKCASWGHSKQKKLFDAPAKVQYETAWKMDFFRAWSGFNLDCSQNPMDGIMLDLNGDGCISSKDYMMLPSILTGRNIYQTYCAGCHGHEGEGTELSRWFSPRPRKFVSGKFRYKSTSYGHLPTDEDLYLSIHNGIPGSAMPSFRFIPPDSIWLLVEYIKSFALADFRSRDQFPVPPFISMKPPNIKSRKEALALASEGENLYYAFSCHECHGNEGGTSAPLGLGINYQLGIRHLQSSRETGSTTALSHNPWFDEWSEIRSPSSFVEVEKFKSGSDLLSVYRTIAVGQNSAPMIGFSFRMDFPSNQIEKKHYDVEEDAPATRIAALMDYKADQSKSPNNKTIRKMSIQSRMDFSHRRLWALACYIRSLSLKQDDTGGDWTIGLVDELRTLSK